MRAERFLWVPQCFSIRPLKFLYESLNISVWKLSLTINYWSGLKEYLNVSIQRNLDSNTLCTPISRPTWWQSDWFVCVCVPLSFECLSERLPIYTKACFILVVFFFFDSIRHNKAGDQGKSWSKEKIMQPHDSDFESEKLARGHRQRAKMTIMSSSLLTCTTVALHIVSVLPNFCSCQCKIVTERWCASIKLNWE